MSVNLILNELLLYKMKIAYLISVYKDPQQLVRMLKALQGKESYFFIHVDAKVDNKIFVDSLPVDLLPYVVFTSKRYYIQWGGFNQVLYQKELLYTCVHFRMCFERVFILTGQDYPLWSNEQIVCELSDKPHKEYVIGLNISEVTNPKKIPSKIILYHFLRDMNNVPHRIKKIFSGSSRILMRFLPFRKKPYIMIKGKRWDVYQSSSYMCITFELAQYVLEELVSNKELIRYFRFSFVPEEMVIPTIIFNSPYKENATTCKKGVYDGLKYLSSVTYFNYDKEIQVFEEKDYEELKKSNKMFARKFASGISETLMNKLDEEHGVCKKRKE